jgi:hypothetical protein
LRRHRFQFLGPHRIEQFGARHKHHPGRQGSEHPTHVSRIDFQIVPPSLDRAHGDCEDDQIRLEARLDREQSANTLTHGHG